MEFRQSLREGQAQTSAIIPPCVTGIHLAKGCEGNIDLVRGHPQPGITDFKLKAVVRILAEAYNRHPEETIQFLRSGGHALTTDDLQEIRIRRDPQIGRRQVEEQQWARVAFFLLRMPGGRHRLLSCLRTLLESSSIDEAVNRCAELVGA